MRITRPLTATWIVLVVGVIHVNASSRDLLGASPSTQNLSLADADTKPDAPFTAGSWTFQAYESGTLGEWSQGQAITTHVGVGYYVRDNLSVNFEAIGGWARTVKTDDQGGFGGFDLLLRQNLITTPNFSFYIDGGAGAQEASIWFPNDSHFNFRLMAGVGMMFRIARHVRLMTGIRYLHISDAGLTDGNNGLNAAEPYMGVMIPF